MALDEEKYRERTVYQRKLGGLWGLAGREGKFLSFALRTNGCRPTIMLGVTVLVYYPIMGKYKYL